MQPPHQHCYSGSGAQNVSYAGHMGPHAYAKISDHNVHVLKELLQILVILVQASDEQPKVLIDRCKLYPVLQKILQMA